MEPGSGPKASTSVDLQIRGSRIAATRRVPDECARRPTRSTRPRSRATRLSDRQRVTGGVGSDDKRRVDVIERRRLMPIGGSTCNRLSRPLRTRAVVGTLGGTTSESSTHPQRRMGTAADQGRLDFGPLVGVGPQRVRDGAPLRRVAGHADRAAAGAPAPERKHPVRGVGGDHELSGEAALSLTLDVTRLAVGVHLEGHVRLTGGAQHDGGCAQTRAVDPIRAPSASMGSALSRNTA